MEPDPTIGLSDDELADLARLVDGTLPPDRRAEVEARVAASPQLSSIAKRQGVALDALHGTASTGAPARLRARVERRQRGGEVHEGGRGRIAIGGAIAAAVAVALAAILVLPIGGAPSVAEAAALAKKPPTQPAPRPVPGTPQLLRAQVDGVPFPNYAAKFRWVPDGARQDAPSGRSATTVYYDKSRRTIAYTIVSGDALHPPSDASVTTLGGVEYRSYRDSGRTVVTWKRGGRTCVLSAKAVPRAELLTLANWRGKGAIPF